MTTTTFGKAAEMKPFIAILKKLGFENRMMQDGSLEVEVSTGELIQYDDGMGTETAIVNLASKDDAVSFMVRMSEEGRIRGA